MRGLRWRFFGALNILSQKAVAPQELSEPCDSSLHAGERCDSGVLKPSLESTMDVDMDESPVALDMDGVRDKLSPVALDMDGPVTLDMDGARGKLPPVTLDIDGV